MMEFTKRTGLSIFESSAKTGNGVESSFIALTDALINLAEQNKQSILNCSGVNQTTEGGSSVGNN